MKKIIGVSGVARSGKDTFVKISMNYLHEKGITCEKITLADELKEDVKYFLQQKFNIDVWTTDSELKTLIRPFLVWIGDIRRKQTNGKYFIEKVNEQISRSNSEYIFISDIRYSHYEYDELQWIKDIGKLIHITQFFYKSKYHHELPEIIDESKLIKQYILPANDHEVVNDPKLKEKADYLVEWKRGDNISYEDLISNEYMKSIVYPIIDDIMKG